MSQAVRLLPIPFLAAALSFAAPQTLPRMDPDPQAAELGRTAEPLPLEVMARAALQFSGTAAADLPALQAALMERAAKARDATADRTDAAARGEALLTFLHQGLAGRYVENQTRLDVLLYTGNYNCVSSAVLYMILGKEAGLEVGGVATKDHAFCTVRTASGPVDVETTNPYGWDPGNRKEFFDSFGQATGYVYVPPKNYADRRAVGEKALLGLILANRAVDLERAGRFAEAVGLAVDRDAAAGDADAAEFLAGRLFNYGADLVNRRRTEEALSFLEGLPARFAADPRFPALRRTAASNRLSELGSAGRYEEGIAFLEAMRARYGDDPAYGDFLKAASNNQVVAFLRAGKWEEARALVRDRLSRGLLDPAEAKRLTAVVDTAELDRAVTELPFRDALQAALRARGNGSVTDARFAEVLRFLYANEGQKTAKTAGWLAAARLVEEGIALLPGDPKLAEIRAAFRGNHAAEAHNRFAALYNAGRYAEAGAAAAGALQDVPESELLRKDVDLAAQAAARAAPPAPSGKK